MCLQNKAPGFIALFILGGITILELGVECSANEGSFKVTRLPMG